MSKRLKHLSFAVMLIAALGLAGCGGGGGTAVEEPPTVTEPTPEELLAEAKNEATMLGTELRDQMSFNLGILNEELEAAEADKEYDAASHARAIDARHDSRVAYSRGIDAINSLGDAESIEEVEAISVQIDAYFEASKEALDASFAFLDMLAVAKAAKLQEEAREEAERIAEEERVAAEKKADEMKAAAAKLYPGISAPSGDPGSPGVNDRAAAYNADNTAILVSVGDGTNTPTAVTLSEDEDASVASRYGWTGHRFTAGTDSKVTHEAIVYSHIEAPTVTEGQTFSEAHPPDGTTGEIGVDTTDAVVPPRIASTSFDQSAGEKTFELPENTVRVIIPGSYRGVAGTYYCTPADNDMCGATVADTGFTLGGGEWSFKPNNPAQKLMETSDPDVSYASYGWWLHTADDGTVIASAFHDYRGTDTVEIAALRGSARYVGGAAGQYALYSTTGGTNDAGHFTATATLEAKFGEAHTISGTINGFVGSDGEPRDWSVALSASTISAAGVIAGDPETPTDTTPQNAIWSIGGVAASPTGTSWSGNIREEGDDGVPAIATGAFYTEFNDDGRMVGGFGANRR